MASPNRTISAIEGLRGIAVTAVIAFHLFPGVVRGGYLGVDLFFVISGYVITSLLAHKVRATGDLSLTDFYKARIRRLLPALVVVSTSVLVLAAAFGHPGVVRGLQDLPYVFSGTYNWRLGTDGISYFDKWNPPLLQHLWSLAIETQFYLIWPVIFFVLTMRFTSARISAFLFVTGALAVFTGLALAPSAEAFDYFATSTHLSGLLLGSALALVWTPEKLSVPETARARAVIDTTGALAAIGLVFLLFFVDVAGTLYRSSFVLAAVVGVVVIAGAVYPFGTTRRALEYRPLTYLGERSYSLYLWHWPVQLLLAPETLSTKLLSFIITLGASELSYRFVEVPLRRGERMRLPSIHVHWSPGPKFMASAAVTLVVAILAGFIVIGLDKVNDPRTPTVSSATAKEQTKRAVVSSPPQAGAIATAAFVGDSVLLGIQQQIPKNFNLQVFDAVVGRQADDVLASVQALGPELEAGAVVINLGNNGKLRHAEVMAIFTELERFKYPVVINARVPRDWQEPNNELLARVAKRFPKVRYVDWFALSNNYEGLLAADKIHLARDGAATYFGAIRDALNTPSPIASSS